MINERGGVVVAGTAYRLEILYYDDLLQDERVGRLFLGG